MHKSKLIDKLKLLNKDELRDFARFIESPYFNTDKRMIGLFDYLKAYYPEFESEDLDREYVAGQLFPEWAAKQYNKISHLMTTLSQLVSDFMTIRELENDRLEWQQLELKAYKRRQGDWFFDSTAKKLNKGLEKGTERGTDYYFHRYRLNHEIYTHNATDRVQIGIDSLHDAIHNLDLFYFSSKLRYSSEVRSRELLFSEKSELVLLDEMLEAVQLPAFENEVFVQVFSLIVSLYQTSDKTTYHTLKELIFSNLNHFNEIEKFDIIQGIVNYCIMKYNKGENEYLIEIFDLYEYSLMEGVWTTEGIIVHIVFDNIVAIACTLERYEWGESFICQYAQYLREDIKVSIETMAMCRLEFSKGNFERTLELLQNVDFVDVTLNVNAKVFQLRCYYELENYEEVFYDACNAFTQYCRRNKVISKATKERRLGFVKFLKRLHQAKYYQKEGRAALMQHLGKQPVSNKIWLEKKIREDVKLK